MDKKEFNEKLDKALDWLGAEQNYFNEFKEDLVGFRAKIKKEANEQKLKGLNILKRDIKYIGRSEARFNKYEKSVEDFIEKLKDKNSASDIKEELKHIDQRLHLEASKLIEESSRYSGEIRGLLNQCLSLLREKKVDEALKRLEELQGEVNITEEWIANLSADLNRVRNLSEEHSNIFFSADYGEFEKKINEMPESKQVDYLKELLHNRIHLSKDTFKWTKKMLRRRVNGSIFSACLAETFEAEGNYKLAAEHWLKANQMQGGKRLSNALRCYQKFADKETILKIRKRLIKALEKEGSFYQAASESRKAGLLLETAQFYEKAGDLDKALRVAREATDWTKRAVGYPEYLTKKIKKNKKDKNV